MPQHQRAVSVVSMPMMAATRLHPILATGVYSLLALDCGLQSFNRGRVTHSLAFTGQFLPVFQVYEARRFRLRATRAHAHSGTLRRPLRQAANHLLDRHLCHICA